MENHTGAVEEVDPVEENLRKQIEQEKKAWVKQNDKWNVFPWQIFSLFLPGFCLNWLDTADTPKDEFCAPNISCQL